ncbi:hypothetical protein NRK67_00500 [Fusobacteria bacterium ZRK30]|nr:hypothetical protein NRK67_00500 [Fusobacteria bacterium ZRK30]
MIVESRVKNFKEGLENTLGSIKFHKEIKKVVDIDDQVIIDSIDSFEEACKQHLEGMKKELLDNSEREEENL